MQVSPFRDPRINGYLLLPVAFRSLSRLSSALSAKASTLRSFQLNHAFHYSVNEIWLFLFLCLLTNISALHICVCLFWMSLHLLTLSNQLIHKIDQYSVFKVRCTGESKGVLRSGLKWTRTTDLTLIRRAL